MVMPDSMQDNNSLTLSVSTASKSFGKVEVLRNIDLKIKTGEKVALMGPSGSGKSTLLNCICGIEPLDGGTICLGGKNLSQMSHREMERIRREQIGYVFQSFHLLPTLSAWENVEFSGQLIGMGGLERSNRVGELLSRVGLSNRENHFPHQLSGGERQRVALARALLHRPRLILADEPTGSLDSESGDQVLKLLNELSGESGISILLVTHDHASTRICDRVITMKDGELNCQKS